MNTRPSKQNPDSSDPRAYARRILLAVTGLSPQVVTETLYALAVKRSPKWVPTKIRLITTATGAREARLNLLTPKTGWFHRMRADYGLPAIAFANNDVVALDRADGTPLDDIRTPEENQLAANLIIETVRDLTADPDTALHVSIAGGRKTMGYYLGYALSLYGRPQDRLSHVLVSEPYETNRDFFYPTPSEHIIRVRRNGKEYTFDAKEADVQLAEIPFVRMRDGLPDRLRSGQSSFGAAVAAANRGHAEPRLVVDLPSREVRVDDELLKLGPTEFTFLFWLARRAREDRAAVDWSQWAAAEEFLDAAKQVLNPNGGDYERIENALEWRRNSAIKLAKYFEPHKSRVNTALQKALGQTAALRYSIVRSGTKSAGPLFYLQLTRQQIDIRRGKPPHD